MRKMCLVAMMVAMVATGCGSADKTSEKVSRNDAVVESTVESTPDASKEQVLHPNSSVLTDDNSSVVDGSNEENPKETQYYLEYVYQDNKIINKYEYDENGLLTKNLKNRSYDEYEYDVYGNVSKVTSKSIKTDKVVSCTTYEYDGLGNVTYCEKSKASGAVESSVVYEYENGRLTSESNYNSEDKKTSQIKYEYDENGNMCKFNKIRATGEMECYEEYDYDENNNRVARRYFYVGNDGDILNIANKYEYNEKNELVAEYSTQNIAVLKSDVDYSSLKYFKTTAYGYDENGNLTNMATYGYDGKNLMSVKNTYKEI